MTDEVTIKGAITGYRRGAIFETEWNGKWEQTCFKFEFNYQYAPTAVLDDLGQTGRLKIDNMGDWVDVKKVG